MKIIDYFCVFFGGRLLGKPRLTFASSWKILARMEKRIFSHDGCSTAKIFPELAQVTSPVKGHSVKRMYVCINALQLNELSALRNTFYPEYKYVCMYVCMYVCN